jgi:outer membrane receptor protein involved in Fe transport
LLIAATAAAQTIPTGTLSGRVTDGNAPLPGVSVTATSPNLQGARVTTSNLTGEFIVTMLPPGLYAVRLERSGFHPVETTLKISGEQTSTLNVVLPEVTAVAAEIAVSGRYETISTTATSAATYESQFVSTLPVVPDVASYVNLAAGTVQFGAFGAQQIAGGVPSENLYLLNGVVSSDNVSGNLLPLHIEDALQETTTTLSSVSAEYGRFTGGVVSALTKSGGNELHGSFRLNLTNPSWTEATPLTIEHTDVTNELWEATLGGYIVRDKLWFFFGGRTTSQTASLQTRAPVSIPVDQTTDEARFEGKLTYSPSPSHRIIGSYLDRERDWENYYWPGRPVYDLDSFYERSSPEDLYALNYSGVLSSAFAVEAQYSARRLVLADSGSRYTDVERGTPVKDNLNGVIYNSPVFCAVCPGSDEKRGATDALLRGSLFLASRRLGSHDLRFGIDYFDDVREVNNYQSGSGYRLDPDRVMIVGTGTDARYYPVVVPGNSYLEYTAILALSGGNRFRTRSAFVNDVWRPTPSVTVNLGVRYDENDGTDATGTTVVSDSKWSPRLSVTWDPAGDGDLRAFLGYGRYVAAINNAVADSGSAAGRPAQINFSYGGPPINASGPELETREVLRQVFAWLDSVGGPMANPQLWFYARAPGYQVFIGDDLRSPGTTEWTVGLAKRVGSRGQARIDYIHRRWDDFYSERVDMTTGQSQDPFGNVYDRIVVENDDGLIQREYRALLLQGEYRCRDRLLLGGNYTYSRLWGNDVNYTGARTDPLASYPEYRDLKWYAPTG